MNFQRGWRRDEPEINLIPLIDLLLVIIIFLVITTTYARFAELQINLPEAQGESAKEVPAQLNVNVDAAGNYRINETAVAFTGVEALREALVRSAGGRRTRWWSFLPTRARPIRPSSTSWTPPGGPGSRG